MKPSRPMNRWWIVLGAVLIQLSLGAVYIWSVFETPLKIYFPEWTEGQVTLPAKTVLLFFALSMILGGRLQDRIGPRKTALLGGLLLGGGLMLASLANAFSNPFCALFWLTLTYSAIGGIGIGTAYVCPVASCVRWFPDKRGLVVGLAVAGFGAGAFFFAPLAKGLITGCPYNLLNVELFDLPKIGLFSTFFVLGFVFCAAVSVGAFFLRKPPQGQFVALYSENSVSSKPLQPFEMLRTARFWLLWITYFCGCCAGLMVIMKTSTLWISKSLFDVGALMDESRYMHSASQGTFAVSILAIFNALGRIFWGQLSDWLGRAHTLMISFIVCATALALVMASNSFALYLAGVCAVGFCFGGFLSLYPAITAEVFGQEYIGANYGWMFTAFGLGGVVGPWLASRLIQSLKIIRYSYVNQQGILTDVAFSIGSYSAALTICLVLCIFSAILTKTARIAEPFEK